MKPRELAYIICRVIAISCFITVIRALPTFNAIFMPAEIRPPFGAMFFSFLSMVLLLLIGGFLWIDPKFFSSLFSPPDSTETQSAISGAELKGIAFSCLGLMILVETIGSAPQATINLGLERLQGIPGSGIRFFVEFLTSIIKVCIGLWLFLGAEQLKKIKNYLVRD